MSITVSKTFRADGVAVDVTSFTIGVLRSDTSAEVVAAGTAMTHSATGIYTYSWDEPADGLSYIVTYTVVYGGATTIWEETVEGDIEDQIPMPSLTGDHTLDTLNSLIVERLRVARAGPKVTYSVHGQMVKWTEYLQDLDRRIDALRKEYVRENPVEEIVIGI